MNWKMPLAGKVVSDRRWVSTEPGSLLRIYSNRLATAPFVAGRIFVSMIRKTLTDFLHDGTIHWTRKSG